MKIVSKNEQNLMDGYYVIVSDAAQIQEVLAKTYEDSEMQAEWVEQMSNLNYRVTFDLEGKEEDCLKAVKAMKARGSLLRIL